MDDQQVKRRRTQRPDGPPALSREQRRIVQWLKQVRFRKALFGVSEKDVWKKLTELNDLFQQALVAERIRYDALLEQQRRQLMPPPAELPPTPETGETQP